MLLKRLFILTLFLFLVACGPAAGTQTQDAPIATAVAPTTAAPEMDDETMVAEVEMATAVPSATAPPVSVPIPDDKIPQLLQTLLTGEDVDALDALQQIQDSGDQRFISVVLELMRARQIGLMQNLQYSTIVTTLESLSGQDLGQDWGAWVEWYGATEHQPPPGFTTWKGRILTGIDPRFAEFLQDEYPSRIRAEEILWGGVAVDGIPALDNPRMITPQEADYLDPWDVVFGIAINGDARAYPLRILDWHEMANDVVGDVPVSLAYCTLCGAAIAYDGRSFDADGNDIDYDFGSSGFLYRSNKLMYDRQTRTLWNQLTGQPVLGELVDSDIRLELLPVVLTTWDEWQAQHPETAVVAEDTGFPRDYTPGAAYGNYFSDVDTMFPVWQRGDDLLAKDQIYTLNINDTPKAYPLDVLTAEQVVNDELAGQNIVLAATRGLLRVNGDNRYVGEVEYQAGGEVRAFERNDHHFSPGPDADTLIDENGNAWQITEEALISESGESLLRINGHLAYWFGWYAFYPETLVYGE